MKEVNLQLNLKTGKAEKSVDKLNKKLDTTTKEIDQSKDGLVGVSNAADRATGGMMSGFTGVVGSVKSVIKSFGSLKMALIATGIGALVVAIGAVTAAFKDSEEGQDKFAKGMGQVSVVLGNMRDKFADLGESIIEAFENPQETWEGFVTSLTDGAKKIKENLVDQITGQFEMMGGMFKKIILEMRISFNELLNDEEEVIKLNKDLDDANKQLVSGYKKVTKAVKEVNDKVVETFEDMQDAAQEWNAQQEKEIKLAGDVADMRAKADKIERKLLVDRSKLESDVALLRLKARQEDKFSAEERKQALLEAQDLENQLLDAETKALKLRRDAIVLENTFSRTNKENKDKEAQAIAAVNRQVANRANVARTLQRELNTINNQIAADLKARLAAERALQDQEIKNEDDLFKFLEERRQTQQEKEIAQLVSQYEKAFALAVDNAEMEKQLQEQLNTDVKAINDKFRKQEEKANEDSTKKQIDDSRQLRQTQMQMASDALSAISQLVTAFAKADEESQRKAFKINKAISMAQAIINTAQAISKALASAVPPANFILAGIAGVAGAAQVATIAKTEFEGGASPSPTNIPSNISTGAESQAPAFNIVGQSGFNQIAGALGQQQPVQAYVVAGDVTTAQQLDNNIITTATF